MRKADENEQSSREERKRRHLAEAPQSGNGKYSPGAPKNTPNRQEGVFLRKADENEQSSREERKPKRYTPKVKLAFGV
ncbi:MAG: hypothetical protein E7377_04900 [Clostridiales bacterium]|nr:hypothetical protein [Clostridiales bacterium]